jgi:3D (Asp-Asp-Asp) domain-containing protein
MALHLSGKAIALGLVALALITAFSAPKDEVLVSVVVTPIVAILDLTPAAVATFQVTTDDGEVPLVLGPRANPPLVVRATAYNSLESQTNSQPFITATGTRTRWGIIAVSRDLLGEKLPYGSLVRLRDLGNFHNGRGAGAYQSLLDGTDLFVVEDTMHPRKRNQVDIWFQDYASAVNWGVRKLEVEVVRIGRHGPTVYDIAAESFQADPRWLAIR